jgi:Flp pilus assembly protein TadD
LDTGQWDEAIQAYEAIGPLGKESAEAWRLNNMGFAYVQSGRPARAIPLLEKAVEADKTNQVALNNLGVAYEHSGRDEEARAAYQKAAGGGNGKASSNLKALEARVSRDGQAAKKEKKD